MNDMMDDTLLMNDRQHGNGIGKKKQGWAVRLYILI
jgi:hypothetical protein